MDYVHNYENLYPNGPIDMTPLPRPSFVFIPLNFDGNTPNPTSSANVITECPILFRLFTLNIYGW